jgi:hypothetical protein
LQKYRKKIKYYGPRNINIKTFSLQKKALPSKLKLLIVGDNILKMDKIAKTSLFVQIGFLFDKL